MPLTPYFSANSYTAPGVPPWQDPPARQFSTTWGDRAKLWYLKDFFIKKLFTTFFCEISFNSYFFLSAMMNLSARAEEVPWAQQEPQ